MTLGTATLLLLLALGGIAACRVCLRKKRSLRRACMAALSVLALESAIVQIAAGKVLRDEPLDWNDYCRLVKAEERIAEARNALVPMLTFADENWCM